LKKFVLLWLISIEEIIHSTSLHRIQRNHSFDQSRQRTLRKVHWINCELSRSSIPNFIQMGRSFYVPSSFPPTTSPTTSPRIISKLHIVFSSFPNLDYEIYIVDDNSTDSTASLVKSHPNTSVHLLEGCVVFSSRYREGGAIDNWSAGRRFVSFFFANNLARFLLKIPFTDVTSAFRVYSRDVFEKIAERSVSGGFAFQVEAAFWCQAQAVWTVEIQVVFRDRRFCCS
jgi:hypothetical protein